MAEEETKQKEMGYGEETGRVLREEAQLESGTYEIIKSRLVQQGKRLRDRLEQLNTSRKEVFGSIENTVLGSERIITRNNCVPKDMVPVNSRFIFGYNVHMGLKTTIKLEDVFAIYEYKERKFRELNLDELRNKQFMTDFQELYKYYKKTRFAKFTIIEPYLYMVFRVGEDTSDIKAFKWLIKDGKLSYEDNRSDHEVRFPPQHDFEWTRATREDHHYGMHPHISIQDRVFVETVGGDLTIKIEDNTESGMGIYAEDVDDPDQTLDDAETFYASVGNLILIKIRPYQEKDFRYFVFNEKIQDVQRVDAIKDSCILLPDDHGLIFSRGYYLQTGEYKLYDIQLDNMIFQQRIAAANGEDFQYIFYSRDTGVYLILSYNLISQTVEPPITCTGCSHFDNGEMILFKGESEPRKNHVIQIWQTPYVGRDYVTESVSDSLLFKLGNQEVVQCMARCHAVFNLIRKEESYVNLYVDIEKETSDILDTYFWLDKEEAFNIKEVLQAIRTAAASAVEEYEKVLRIKASTRKQINRVKEKSAKLFKEISFAAFDTVNDYVNALAQLRGLRGEVISLKDLRYTDIPLIESLENEITVKNEELSGRCVEFLLEPEGLNPYLLKVDEQATAIPEITKGAEGKQLDEEMGQTAGELELLIDIVGNLKIEDPTQTTEIIDRISTIYASLNQAKSKLHNRLKDLRRIEGEAEFNSQMKLINQAVVNYIGVADTPEKCEEYLTKVTVQLEELEGKFADFEEFIPQLTEKREELYSAFESKKLAILEKRNKRAGALLNAAERILNGMRNRLKSFTTVNEINGYFASDLMVEKVRDIVTQLLEMADTVKADDVQGRLKTIREDAVRQLKDRQDLFVEGGDIIKFGNHLFTVNTQHLDLSLVRRDDNLFFHMTGTDYWQVVDSPELEELREVWDQDIVSENRNIYRAEYLAYKLMQGGGNNNVETKTIEELNLMDDDTLVDYVRKFMAPRYRENYTKGLHDLDGTLILKALLKMHNAIDLLIYSPSARALAALYWERGEGRDTKTRIGERLKGLQTVTQFFKGGEKLDNFLREVESAIHTFTETTGLFSKDRVPEAALYLCRELMRGSDFVISSEAEAIYNGFMEKLKTKNAGSKFGRSLEKLSEDLPGAFYLAKEWLRAYYTETGQLLLFDDPKEAAFLDEVIVLLLTGNFAHKQVVPVKTAIKLEGLNGNHPLIENGIYLLSYSGFMDKLRLHDNVTVPMFLRFQEVKKAAAQELKTKLRLDEFQSRVLSSFVRNKLIDKVYLPLIGDNLAKQMGVAGESKRTDLMGLLLLISPPGYGKTTLMEYIANRLGLIFVKINGPAIGHQVTSLDPAEAQNTGAKEELKKLNLAFEMGNNIMIYVDDIQHTNPEFLQKFISLCDAQRKIEGIHNGVGRTYDLRGKKVAVVMAGNPYTESGEKFKIPDMLANRADVYNLGDMLRENEDAFKLSYIENSLTSNPILNKLITRSRSDVYAVIDAAEQNEQAALDLEGNYSTEEVSEFIAVLQKLFRVRDVVLDVNMEYIHSAAQPEEYRTEPAFKLQGSYRNQNRIAEKVMAVMNDEELGSLIEGAYESDAQTLATGAEANMLKWKELTGRLSKEENNRWQEIKRMYNKNKLVKSDDTAGQMVLQLNEVGENLVGIKDVISKGMAQQSAPKKAEEDPTQYKIQQQLMEGLGHLKNVIENGFGILKEALSKAPAQQSSVSSTDMVKIMAELKDAIASGITVAPTVVSAPSPAAIQTQTPAPGKPTAAPPAPSTLPEEPVLKQQKKQSGAKPFQIPITPTPAKKTPTTARSRMKAKPQAKPSPGPKTSRVKRTEAKQFASIVPEHLEVSIENFNVVSADMAKRMMGQTDSISEDGIDFGKDYCLKNASIERLGADNILLLLFECLKDPVPGQHEKIDLALLKSGKKIWSADVQFSDKDHLYKKGDRILGRVKLENITFRIADQLGIRVNAKTPENKWAGMKVEDEYPTDQNGKRLLIKLQFRHKY